MPFLFPKVYPILDASYIPPTNREPFLLQLGAGLAKAGVTLLEYRNKSGSDAEIMEDTRLLRGVLPVSKVKLILDDRVDLVHSVDFDGVHVDDGDPSPGDARKSLGPSGLIGAFGGSENFQPGALNWPVDYLAVGPVFTTRTKATSKPPIGIDGVRRMRSQAGPDRVLTAAAGITLETARAVLAAGATTVAVCSALFDTPDPAGEFSRWFRALGE